MLWFMRCLKLSWPACHAGAFAFAFSAVVIMSLNHSYTGVSVLIPGLAASWHLWLNDCKNRLRWMVSFVILAGLQQLGGHPETCLNTAVILWLYTWTAQLATADGRSQWRHGLISSCVVLPALFGLGLLLAAVQTFPLLEAISQSTAGYIRTMIHANDPHYTTLVRNPAVVIAAIMPKLFGSPVTRDWIGEGNFSEISAMFVTLTAVLLVSIAVAARRARDHAKPFCFLFLACALFAFYNPLSVAFSHLPLLSLNNWGRLIIGCAFAMCALTAVGVEAITSEWQPRILKRGVAVATAVIVMICVLVVTTSKIELEMLHWGAAIRSHMLPFILVCAGMLLACLNPKLRPFAAAIVVSCMMLEAKLTLAGYQPASPIERLSRPPKVAQWLRSQPGHWRAAPIDHSIFPPETNLFAGIPIITGYDAVGVRRYYEYLQAVNPFPITPSNHMAPFVPFKSPGLDFLATRYYICHAHQHLGHPDMVRAFPPAGEKYPFAVYENKAAFPRAYL
ncbi:MAG: hypothetical protein ACYTDT_14565, partial [Planctomycetota bacterium]